MGRRRKNLYLVLYMAEAHGEMFQRIATEVERIAPHIRARVIRDHRAREKRWGRIFRPTLTVSMVPLERLRPLRGALCTGRRVDKVDELEMLARAGIPTPRWTRLEPDVQPDLSGYGAYLVVKPTHGSRGAGVQIKRTDRVRHKRYDDDLGPRIAQEFIYTGRWPVTYRVTLLFGRVLFAIRSEANRARRPLEGRDRIAETGGASIVSTGRDCTYALTDDEEILELGRRVAAVFPDQPLIGMDIVRDHGTGRLFVLEANPGGWTFYISSETGRGIQRENGIDLETQFGAVSIAARALAEETDRRAR